MSATHLTERLVLRRWRDADLAPFAALNADPQVMRHFPDVLSRQQSDVLVARLESHHDSYGFGLWAVERRDNGSLIGFTGLQHVPFDAPFTPAVEVGWRLARPAWGHGFATEAARESLRVAFIDLELDEVVAMTVPANVRSLAVMERIGMLRSEADDFDHPRMLPGSPLRRHVLYRIARTMAPPW